MGAPGLGFFCKKGHLYNWIQEHLYWDDDLFIEADRIKEEGCDCGEPFLLQVVHYGNLNDCVCLPDKVEEEGIKLTGEVTKILQRIKDALDSKGQPIEAYRWLELPIYDLSKADQG